MEWILNSPQVNTAFASLGHIRGDTYHVSENCNSTLEDILKNISSEDKCLRSYRRIISFGQNVQKDLMPLLINTKDEETVGLLIKILMNLTIPVECLLILDVNTKTDFGRHTIFELRNLLSACKNAFVDPGATKSVVDYLKKNSESKEQSKLSLKQCENIHDCLTLLRNVLHIADEVPHRQHARDHSSHNQILWNIFSQGVDKIIIKLMTIPEASNWSATMVQLIAVLYKDQHVGKLQKLLNVWLETSLSESSEDNESNTSPQNRETSPMLTTDQTTSDSSDNCVKGKGGKDAKNTSIVMHFTTPGPNDAAQPPSDCSVGVLEDYNNKKHYDLYISSIESYTNGSKNINTTTATYAENQCEIKTEAKESESTPSNKRTYEDRDGGTNYNTYQQSCSPPPRKILKTQSRLPSENSDCGYGTQIETRESISTSSNDDDRGAPKLIHTKPRNPKHKANTKVRISYNAKTLNEKRRKKMMKRGKSNILNVQGLQYHQPTDDDITVVLKEFTVDFMLKGYSSLVRTLHKQILNYNEVEIDRCHFFWLLTYFLKFATQMELESEHVESVLTFDVISFLTAEGVNLCEQFELAIKYSMADLNIWRRKLHLVVTAIREFVQAIDTFKKIWSASYEENDPLIELQMKMWETPELRSLMILLIRSYNSDHHDKQYLQDLVVTNHVLLLFLDNVIKLPGYAGNLSMIDHIRQFATPHMMCQYGVLLEDFETNGEFVNDCVFTIMHHVGGDMESLPSLYRTNILRAFSSIKHSDYEICDHWTDLVEYVMNSFTRQGLQCVLPPSVHVTPTSHLPASNHSTVSSNRWTDNELSALGWNYMQSKNTEDVIGNVVKLYKEEGVLKTRASIIDELYQQNLIAKEQHDFFAAGERRNQSVDDEIRDICEDLIKRGYADMVEWVQSNLLEVCYVKICLAKIAADRENTLTNEKPSSQCNKFKNIMSPVVYHNIILNKSISLVPWNCRQAAVCKDAKFIQLMTKLNFYMPSDSGMMFFRIPQIWTVDVLYEMSLKISNIDTSKLKFSISDMSRDSAAALNAACMIGAVVNPAIEVSRKMSGLPIPEHCYRIQRYKQIGAMVHYTPTPDPAAYVDNADESTQVSNPGKVDWLTLIKKAQRAIIPTLPTSCDSFLRDCGHDEKLQSADTVLSRVAGTAKECKYESIGTETTTKATEQQPNAIAHCSAPSSCRMSSGEQSACEITSLEGDSLCDTASMASEFSRMYVSDEEERAELTDLRAFSLYGMLCDDSQAYTHAHVGEQVDAHGAAYVCSSAHPRASSARLHTGDVDPDAPETTRRCISPQPLRLSCTAAVQTATYECSLSEHAASR